MRRYEERIFSWLLVILVPVFAIFPALTSPIEEHSFDAAAFHVNRGILFSAARAEGILYPRWVQSLDAGLGGPLFSFYSPLSYFAMDALHSIGFSYPHTWRILVALAFLAASIGVFLVVRSLTGTAYAAVPASAVYVYSFPFLRDLLERGSPEGLSFSLYPWVLWGTVRLVQQTDGVRLAISALLWTVMILTHNLSSFFLLPVFGLLVVLLALRSGRWALIAPVAALCLGALVAAFYIVPFIAERDFVQIANTLAIDYAQAARAPVTLPDFFQLPSLYDINLDNNYNGGPLGPLGLALVVAGLIAGLILGIKRRWWEAAVVIGFAALAALIIWLQTASANFVWEAIPALAYVQMRTRFLGLVNVSVAIVCGFLLKAQAERLRPLLSIGIAVIAISAALPVLYPQLQYRYNAFAENPTVNDVEEFALSEDMPGLTAFNEFRPIWRRVPFTEDEERKIERSLFDNLPPGSRVISEERAAARADAKVESPQAFDAVLHVYYYPGWVGYVDGKAYDLQPVEGLGYILLKGVPAGTHTISLRYEGTQAQFIGALISAATLTGLFFLASVWRSKKKAVTSFAYLKPNWYLAAGVVILIGAKAFWLDPDTTLLRQSSSCSDVQGGVTEVGVRFGDRISLCAVDLPEREFRPGDTVKLVLYWEATNAVYEPAQTFVHLLGGSLNAKTNNPLWGQQDKQLPGLHPVTRWMPGKIYRDKYEFRIDSDAPAGDYALELGWWQSGTGQRLKPEITKTVDRVLKSDFDSILLTGIVVR